jgi:hypothetical protein
MTPQQIAKDIERGAEIRAEIARLKKELKAVEGRIKQAAQESPHRDLEDENREGKQALLRSSKSVLPVRFTSDSIVASFDPDTELHLALRDIAGDKLGLFYEEVRKFQRVPKDGVKFRRIARENLEPKAFAELIHAATQRTKDGIAKSATVIAWDDLRPADQVA